MSDAPALATARPRTPQWTDDAHALVVGPALLQAGVADGPLSGTAFVAKDLFDVAGERTGAGNPDFRDSRADADVNAWAVDALVRAGADLIGKSHTDELAFSLSGTNVHYGTPQNPRAPGRIPGGSSSGSAAAVASGLVPFALATDTGGSIRIPASYCGIVGMRPSHGRIPVQGLVTLAPRFDTVGVLARDGDILRRAMTVLLESSAGRLSATRAEPLSALVLATDVFALAEPQVAAAVLAAANTAAADLRVEIIRTELAGGRLLDWRSMFMARQLADVWATHGAWVRSDAPRFGPGVQMRMTDASQADPARGVLAELGRAEVLAAIERALPVGGVLVVPTASTVAPPIDLDAAAKGTLRSQTIAMTCIAGLGGLPAVSVPLAEVDGLPVGLCLIGRVGDDERLLDLAAQLVPESTTP